MAKKMRVRLLIAGRVQGVFFRDWIRKKAQQLGVFGWVRNLEDGRVEILAEAEREKLEELIKLAKKGPILARVDKIDVEWGEYQREFENFEIRYD